MKSTYIFNYFTGYGYREISSHTIKHYPIRINTEDEQEAITKCLKRASKLVQFNDCYERKTVIPVILYTNKQEKCGLFFIEDKTIKWEGDKVYHSPQVFEGVQYIQSFKVPNKEFASVSSDYTLICTRGIYSSLTSWFKYVWQRMNGDKTYWSTKDTRTEDLQKYFFKEIQDCIKSNKFLEENKPLQNLYELNLPKL